jgi:DNA-binding winged helix-turn-helix (wHTH) protein
MSMTTGVVPMQASYDPTSTESTLLSSGRYIRLGPFQIDQQRQEITKNGEKLKLQGKVYRVLMTLLEKPGEVVTREELRQRLWPAETYVNYDANVNTTVNKLRLALGDSSERPIYIETIPRRGYCLLVQPEISATPTTPAVSLSEPGDLPTKLSDNRDARPRANTAGRNLDAIVDFTFCSNRPLAIKIKLFLLCFRNSAGATRFVANALAFGR